MSVDARPRLHPARQSSSRSEYDSPASVYSDSPIATSPIGRPSTDNLLEYYHSEDAGRLYVQPAATLTVHHRIAVDGLSSSSSSSLLTPAASAGRRSRDPSPAPSGTSHSSHSTTGRGLLSDSAQTSKPVSETSTTSSERRRYATAELDSITPTKPDRVSGPRAINSPRREPEPSRTSSSNSAYSSHDSASFRRSEPTSPLVSSPSSRYSSQDDNHRSSSRPQSDIQDSHLSHKKQRSASRDIGIVGIVVPPVHSSTRSAHTREQAMASKNYSKDGSLHSAPIFLRSQPPEPATSSSSSSSSTKPTGSRGMHSAPAHQTSYPVPPDSRSHDSSKSKSKVDQRPNSTSGASSAAKASPGATPVLAANALATEQSYDWNPSFAQQVQISDPEYLSYVAGMHSKAGPLPSPPRTIIPPSTGAAPPRPPRLQSPPPGTRSRRGADSPATQSINSSLLSAVSAPPSREASRPHSLSNSPLKVPASIPPSLTGTPESNTVSLPPIPIEDDEKTPRRSRHHVREAASSGNEPLPFEKPSRDRMHLPRSDPVVITVGEDEDDSGRRTTDTESRKSTSKKSESSKPTIERQPSWQSELNRSPNGHAPQHKLHPSDATATPIETGSIRSVQSHNSSASVSASGSRPQAVRRTSSSLSISRASARSSIMSPATLHAAAEDMVRPRRQISANPPAMQFTDVLAFRTSVERAAAYSRKMKELTQYQCGLEDWLQGERERKTRPHHASSSTIDFPKSPGSSTLLNPGGSPRKVSHGSIASEATFPVRADAYVATDLTYKGNLDEVETVSGNSMNMPYPSLVRVPSRATSTTSTHTATSASSGLSVPTSMSMTGFLASIGRKASMRSPKSSISAPLPGSLSASPTQTTASKLLSSRLPISPPQTKLSLGPTSIPGGPRSPSNRMIRAPSLLPQKRTPMATIPQEESISLTRSPSLPVVSRLATPIALDQSSFNRQVDKLADILPHVDRGILAGYLRRAGQDILAIGQYLEDEKNGRVRYDI